MSYPYRVVVTKGVEERVSASDRSEKTVEIPPLVDAEQAREILRAALQRRGWEGQGSVLTRKQDGLEQSFDLETGLVTTAVEGEETIEKELTLEGTGDSWTGRASAAEEEALRRKVEEEVDKRLEVTEDERRNRREELEERLARKLEETDEARTEELNEVLLEVYAESLKEKARGLGTVTEVREERTEGGEYELTIRVEA